MDKIKIFIERLEKIGIKIKIAGNYPWVYLEEINGKCVTEKYLSKYSFTLAFLPMKPRRKLKFTNITKIFKLIRKYC